MLQILQNFGKFQNFQLENLVDFAKCCQTHIFLQKLVPIQPKTSDVLPKFFQKLATTLRVHYPTAGPWRVRLLGALRLDALLREAHRRGDLRERAVRCEDAFSS